METLAMSGKERQRLAAMSRVAAGELKLVDAAKLLNVSVRQAKRILARYREQGDAGLVHRLRGRPSNRGDASPRKQQALALYSEKYAGYGPVLAAECLEQDDGLALAASTLRQWLLSAGLWHRCRERKVHRRRRPRREHRGELVQMDGSHHDWFAGRREWAVLMVMIDDATGRTYARFFENESWDSAANTLRGYVQEQGLPQELYVDRAAIYRADREPTPEEILAETPPTTQFGRAMAELGVRLILAGSPQAKGRVERVNRTLQDRLVKALTRAGICTLSAANEFLETTFLPAFNQRFGKPPARRRNVHRQLADAKLVRVLSIREERVVQNDWTVRWDNGFLQLGREAARHVQPGQRVIVSQQLDGRRCVFVGDRELAWSPTRDTSLQPRKPPKSRGCPTGSSQGQKPRKNHPWRGTSPPSPVPTAAVSGVGLGYSASVAPLPPLRSPIPPQNPK
jgi:transposase